MMGSRRRGWRRRVVLCGDCVVLLCVLAWSCLFWLVIWFGLRGHIYTQDIRMTFSLLSLYPSKVAVLLMDPTDTKDETVHRMTPHRV
jgi:hypothetical protein